MSNQRIQFIISTITILAIGGFFVFNQTKFGQEESKKTEISINPIQTVYAALPERAKPFYYQQSDGLTKPVPERLVELDQLTIGCFGTKTIMQMSSTDTNLGGQCCGVLKDIGAYEEQLPALHSFIEENGSIELIPKDPYDIPVIHAQTLIAFDTDITLTPEQQIIYDEAVALSHHGGPCCCKCWKWYMMSGLGKKLITDYNWDSEQLAELWDLSSSCGHAEDTNMQEHYKKDSTDGHTDHSHFQ